MMRSAHSLPRSKTPLFFQTLSSDHQLKPRVSAFLPSIHPYSSTIPHIVHLSAIFIILSSSDFINSLTNFVLIQHRQAQTQLDISMAKTKPGKKDLDTYTIKGTNKLVRRTLSLSSSSSLFIYMLLSIVRIVCQGKI